MTKKRKAERTDKSGEPKHPKMKLPLNTTSYVQILGTGMDTQDTSPCVLLFFDQQRFIFNAGEGLQRFCTEHKIKLSKIDHMFLTRVCSETAGGLPGLLLTLAGMGEEGMYVNIWGPSDLEYLVDAMRSFVPNIAMVNTHSFGVTQNSGGATLPNSDTAKSTDPIVLIDDEIVRISAIPLRPSYSGGLEDAMDAFDIPDLTSLRREESTSRCLCPLVPCLQSSLNKIGSTLKPDDIAVIYVCELPEIKAKFITEKVQGISGFKFAKLLLGKSVMSDDGTVMVNPSDVLHPSSPGPIVLIIDCPTPFHMLEMMSVQSLNCYYKDFADQQKEGIKSVNCIIHLGPAYVTKNANYQKWMKRFGSAQHIMAGHEIKNMGVPILNSSARISSRLNYLCPQFFPALGFWSLQHINNYSLGPKGSDEDPSTLCQSISAENLLKFHLLPKDRELDRSVIPSLLDHVEIVNDLLLEIPEIVDVSKHVSQFWQTPVEDIGKQVADASKEEISCLKGSWKEEIKHNSDIPACLENITREDMEIILLGTGSSQPSKYRNVSSIFVNLFSKGGILLDCGEGTLSQLKRRFGVNGADEAIKGLKCIWISHIHADHHTGLARILALRSQLLKGVPHKPLLVIGPEPLKRFLDAYSRLEDLNMQFLDCRQTTEASLNALLCSRDSHEDCSPEHVDEKDDRVGGIETIISQRLDTTSNVEGSITQSYWKGPWSPVDTAIALPVLMRLKEVLCETGLEALYSVPVIHCPHAFGVVMKAAKMINCMGKAIPGWKLVYSGDTRPCQSLIDAARDATVLIHEATFDDSMRHEAIAKNHSTTMEAMEVGRSAGAYRIILTHFSQRYPKIPVFDETDMHNACIAFDLMSVNVADLPVLPMILPYLKILFKNDMIVDESI